MDGWIEGQLDRKVESNANFYKARGIKLYRSWFIQRSKLFLYVHFLVRVSK